MKQDIGDRAKCCGLFVIQVLAAVAVLVVLVLAVGGLPARTKEEVSVDTTDTDETFIYRLPDKWSELDREERLWVLDAIQREVGSPVGQIFIILGGPDAPYRKSKNETHLFDSYGLMFPGSLLPFILLTPSISSNKDEMPPPFQTLPLNNVPFRRDSTQSSGDSTPVEVLSVSTPSDVTDRRIPGFVYYNGVPVLLPKALGKIPIKMEAIREMIAQRGFDQ